MFSRLISEVEQNFGRRSGLWFQPRGHLLVPATPDGEDAAVAKNATVINISRHERSLSAHDDVMAWKYFPHYWPLFVLDSLFRITTKKHQSSAFLALCHGNPRDKEPEMRSFDVSLLLAWTYCWATVELPVISDAIPISRLWSWGWNHMIIISPWGIYHNE